MRTVRYVPISVAFVLVGIVVLGASVPAAHAEGDKRAEQSESKAPEQADKVKNPIEPTKESVARGEVIFQKNCAGCHGEKGRGDGKQAKALSKKPADLQKELPEHSDAEIFAIIGDGKRPMPPFKRDLKPEERWDIVNYLRKVIQKPKAAAADSAKGKATK